MEKEAILEIEFTRVWDKWAWRITKQDEDVFERGVFDDTDLRVFSSYSPQFNSYDKSFFIRGNNKNLDGDVNLCTNKEKEIIEEKVKAINKKYRKPKRWRAEYEGKYFFVTSHGEVRGIVDCIYEYDTSRYNFGNYFQTRKQAEKALEKVKKALQEVGENE